MPANPLAFPRTGEIVGKPRYDEPGMDLRDYFAAQAIPAIIAATSAGQHHPGKCDADAPLIGRMAADAYDIADAMLAERERANV